MTHCVNFATSKYLAKLAIKSIPYIPYSFYEVFGRMNCNGMLINSKNKYSNASKVVFLMIFLHQNSPTGKSLLKAIPKDVVLLVWLLKFYCCALFVLSSCPLLLTFGFRSSWGKLHRTSTWQTRFWEINCVHQAGVKAKTDGFWLLVSFLCPFCSL